MGALVGRRQERERLAHALARATAGEGSLVLVGGEAGVGKTSLVESLAPASGVRVLRGASAHGATAPYGPIVAALRSHLRSEPGALGDCGPLLGHLAVLMPELGRPAATTDRATLFEALRSAISHLASDQPLLLALDDLHWSDAATLDLLAGLAESLGELPVLVVAT
ncbi:MAG TPA: ATP-binding protein, partial [Thermoleophilaceae bacterium]